MSIEVLLSRLENVRQTGCNRWVATCPAHDDRRPSLSIKRAENEYVLIHCFAGCRPEEVLQVLGLSWSALFPGKKSGNLRITEERREKALAKKAFRKLQKRIIDRAADLLRKLDQKLLEAQDISELEQEPWATLLYRKEILGYLWDEVRCGKNELILELVKEVKRWKTLLCVKNI